MKEKKNIFDHLTLKKKIALSKKHRISDELSSESSKNLEIIKQIKELQLQKNELKIGPRSAYFLKSDSWYSEKLAEELQKTETKQKFIEKELDELRKKIAIDYRNVTRAESKSREIRKNEEIIRENKRDLLTPKINKL